ncbi:aldo/keto reductase [Halobacillus kuroshimensis]|uniref:Aldo/keto reductase n=1 Tax=Halobacillus kuroshimensis TaxID=302481 RepID=A0ABS3E0M5_9BACI|nr:MULTISPECIES: aldo/keto reductase [Halobacillus]MBN8237153.1 aldo/keto reductase [Halobacillus kuroshimensis]
MKTNTKTLNNGLEMPEIGYGVFRVDEGEALEEAVVTAIKEGYRSIDTAAIYGNERSVGNGIKKAVDQGLVKRGDLFVTSKVWNDGLDYEGTINAYEESLEKLGLDYLDLYLIHWPGNKKYEQPWKAMESLYKEGRVKSIGVSNFQVHHLDDLLSYAEVKPVINQVEFHPKLTQQEVREYGKKHDIQVEAWSPLMNADLLDHPVIQQLAQRHDKSPAQIILRWDIQHDVVTIPKSMTPSRIRDNISIYDFELDTEEMKQLDGLNENARSGPHPDEFDF